MAHFKSFSYSVSTGRWKYDVFLSFRGEDTRYTFVDHLHTALVLRGICVFKDDEELRKGKTISPQLFIAIEESRFVVVVLSKNYANSSWCLVELAKIMECHNRMGQKVIPVFYHVDPSDIRAQKNDVAFFFRQHEERFREETEKVNMWREALTATTNLSGMHISEKFKEGESTYINKIVHEILCDIQPCDMENNIIGINSHMDALNSLLRTQEKEEVCIVGIYGMGGIGKTTIAKALFRRISYMFESSSFVTDVRDNSSSKRDICALQEKILRDILMIDHNFNLQDPEDGANMIRARFVHKKVLVVLDDVDDRKQLEFLAVAHDSFGPGSRIIITTRNEQLLYDSNAKYKPDFLLMDEALELFSIHAFKTSRPPKGYEELSCRAIRCAGYLPLAVKVLGSFFHGRKAFVWESAFNRLAKALNVEIFETLKLSFDGLEVTEKKIFLDIACFFKGKHIGYVTHVLESCGFDPLLAINVLIEKSLITVSNHIIGMHDLIQEMGLQIVRESFPNSRLWQLQDVHHSLNSNRKLKAIEAIVVSNKQYNVDKHEEEIGFSANVFERMENLRLLNIRGRFTSCEPTVFPEDLRWLCWSEYPFSSLTMSQIRKLVGLEVVGGAIKHFWNGQKIMPNLKLLRLHQLDSLTMFPDVSVAPNIKKLILSRCTNLVKVHESLGSHKRIFRLHINGCERLKRLPSRFEMASLRHLKLTKCLSLEKLPDVSPCMVNLSSVVLDFCSSVKELPSSFGYLSRLGYFSFRRYTSLPYSINLHTLTNWCSLRTLNLSCRPAESEVFLINLHAFSSLETLDLSGNNNLIQLPATISCLSRLRKLYLNECHQLQVLHALPSRIQVLEANNCYSLEKINDILTEYDWWYHISFINCHKLLMDENNKRYLDKMLKQSYLQRIAIADRELRIGIPGNKIPRWFKEEQPGHRITLMIPPKCETQIIGIVICGVFPGEWQGSQYGPRISVEFKKDGWYISKKEVDGINVCDSMNGNMWISYKPFSSFGGFQRKDWPALRISINGEKALRCATRLVYKEDTEWIQKITTCISQR